MPSKKLPYMPFYIGDYRKDTGVKALDLEGKGLWTEMLWDMWESTERGKLLINGNVPDEKVLANSYGISLKKFKKIKEKLIYLGVASVDEKTGCLYNRRMVRDEEIRVIRSNCGKKGGNPALKDEVLVDGLLNQKDNQNTDIDNDIETDNKVLTKTIEPSWKKEKQDAFEKRWYEYPGKKNDKAKANKSWNSSIKKKSDIEDYDIAAQIYIADVEYDRKHGFKDLRFKYGTTWFNNWRAALPEKKPTEEVKETPQKPRDPNELDPLWNEAKEKIKAEILPENYEKWFEPTYPRSLEGGKLVISVPDQFFRKCLTENYRDLIEKTLTAIQGSNVLVDFCIGV